MKILKKLLPFQKAEAGKPLHAGEIYHLWEGLTSGHRLIETVETYIMNTEDTELHAVLSAIIKGAGQFRINRLEKVLKEQGFTVPPRPSTKVTQGKPGAGQEVKLSDVEVIHNLISLGQVLLVQSARAVGACTRESVRKVFTDLLFDEIKAYKMLIEFGKMRKVFNPSPPATAKDNGLNMGEVFFLWEELGARHLSLINMEAYLANTNDKDLINLIRRGLNEIIIPQIEKLENILKDEGFTVPARPPRRLLQGPPGQVNKIKLSDDEIIGVLMMAFQVAITYHLRALISVMRKDVAELFEQFLSTEVEEYQKLIDLATARHALDNPPLVTSRQG